LDDLAVYAVDVDQYGGRRRDMCTRHYLNLVLNVGQTDFVRSNNALENMASAAVYWLLGGYYIDERISSWSKQDGQAHELLRRPGGEP
jgi:hypothetical protein